MSAKGQSVCNNVKEILILTTKLLGFVPESPVTSGLSGTHLARIQYVANLVSTDSSPSLETAHIVPSRIKFPNIRLKYHHFTCQTPKNALVGHVEPFQTSKHLRGVF